MYKELIERLRVNAEWAEGNEWEIPLMMHDDLTAAADAIEKLQASYSQVTDTLRRNGFGSFDELLASFRQANAERAELIRLLKERAECELCKHDTLRLPCADSEFDICCETECGHEKVVCCGCGGVNWEWRGLEVNNERQN